MYALWSLCQDCVIRLLRGGASFPTISFYVSLFSCWWPGTDSRRPTISCAYLRPEEICRGSRFIATALCRPEINERHSRNTREKCWYCRYLRYLPCKIASGLCMEECSSNHAKQTSFNLGLASIQDTFCTLPSPNVYATSKFLVTENKHNQIQRAVVHIPPRHQAQNIALRQSGWTRACRYRANADQRHQARPYQHFETLRLSIDSVVGEVAMDQTSLVAFLVDWFTQAKFDTATCPEHEVATLGVLRKAPGPIVWHRRNMRWTSIPFAIEIAGTVLSFFGECGAFEGEAEAAVVQGYYTPGDGIPYMPSDKRPDTLLTIRVVIVSEQMYHPFSASPWTAHRTPPGRPSQATTSWETRFCVEAASSASKTERCREGFPEDRAVSCIWKSARRYAAIRQIHFKTSDS